MEPATITGEKLRIQLPQVRWRSERQFPSFGINISHVRTRDHDTYCAKLAEQADEATHRRVDITALESQRIVKSARIWLADATNTQR